MTGRLPAPHAEHDPLLVAAFAAGDLGPADRERAELLAATCAECALLAVDLQAIATATAALPERTRPRDFSLRAEDAARLRRRGWRGLLRGLAGPRSRALKPLATGLTTLGIAGLLLAAVPAMQLGGSAGSAPAADAGAPASTSGKAQGSERDRMYGSTRTADPGSEGAYSSPPARQLGPVTVAGPTASPAAVADEHEGRTVVDPAPSGQPDAAPEARAVSPLVVLSGTFLVLGLGLFGLRWSARRLGDQ